MKQQPLLTKVTRKGQVTIPEGMRRAYGIREGDFLLVRGVKGLVMFKKLSMPNWKELFEYGQKFAEKKRIDRAQILRAVRDVRHER